MRREVPDWLADELAKPHKSQVLGAVEASPDAWQGDEFEEVQVYYPDEDRWAGLGLKKSTERGRRPRRRDEVRRPTVEQGAKAAMRRRGWQGQTGSAKLWRLVLRRAALAARLPPRVGRATARLDFLEASVLAGWRAIAKRVTS